MNFKSLSILNKDLLMVGYVTGTFSLDGSVKLKPYLIDFNLFSDLLFSLKKESEGFFLYLAPHFPKKTKIKKLNSVKKDFVVSLDKILDIDEANSYVNAEIYIDKDYFLDFLKEKQSPYLYLDFTVTNSKQNLGKVDTILINGSQFLLKIINKSEKETLVPLVKEYIEDIDFKAKNINLNLPEGFLDIYEI